MAGLRWLSLVWLLLLVLLPRGLRGAWIPGQPFCPLLALDARGRSRWLSFVGRRPEGPVLVQSAWDPEGGLLACAWRSEPSLIRWYEAFCGAAGLEETQIGLRRALWGTELRRRMALLEAEGDSCLGRGSKGDRGLPPAAEGLRRRRRRGWTMPGTLWCGAGDSAAGDFSQLGVFQGPDVCCREHDQCEAQISALGYKYGMRNYRFHTISHCDCDLRFRQCLMTLNDTISNFIGLSFFNLLEVPCFVLEESEECVEWHWWGGCKTYGPMPLARLVEQSHYHPVVAPTEQSSLVTLPPGPGRHRGKGRKHNRKNRRNRKRLNQKARERKRLHLEHPEAQVPGTALIPVQSEPDWISFSPAATTSGLVPVNGGTVGLPTLGAPLEPGLLKTTAGDQQRKHPKSQATQTEVTGPPSEAGQKEEASLEVGRHSMTILSGSQASVQNCSCYRRLDQCPYRIGPHEVKYQLHNLDSRTLFHCNCTRRLARFLRKRKGLNEVEGQVLSDYVSTSCFVLQPPLGCRDGQEEQPNCIDVGRAILVPARHLTNQLAHKHWGTSLKVKRQERKPPDRSLRLFNKCRQLARAARHAVPSQT
ncbi:group 3 secretory phospholipase A2 [Sceloporus undulatus]|uniref:group 3 secretory phospholipase A2 n=1 Tax=Sceloporus undulatus TaxID=8520 RepID=UPI001C4D049E|nr:group 3 secretory phospholipase A2 [Sceloporus undulatus]